MNSVINTIDACLVNELLFCGGNAYDTTRDGVFVFLLNLTSFMLANYIAGFEPITTTYTWKAGLHPAVSKLWEELA